MLFTIDKGSSGPGIPCNVVLADSWFCVNPFISALQKLGLGYVPEIKTNATVQVPIPRTGRKGKYWYKKRNIVKFMKYVRKPRIIGFLGDFETGKPDKELYKIKEKIRANTRFLNRRKTQSYLTIV